MSFVDITGVVTSSPSAPTISAWPEGSVLYEVPAQQRLIVESGRMEDGSLVFTVSDAITGVFGTGSTPIEAVQDLARALKEHREVLEDQQELSPALEQQLRYLQRR